MKTDQPKPTGEDMDIRYTETPYPATGEWTVETVEALMVASLNPGWIAIADAHNAALTAEREMVKFQNTVIESLRVEHNAALADERKKVQALVDALKESREYIWDSGYFDTKSPLIRVIDAAIAKVEEGK